MNLLVLKNFNNYFNRIIKRYTTLSDYEDRSYDYKHILGINFNPNDGIRTEQILGKGQIGDFCDFEATDCPDYLVCYTIDKDNNVNIETRWFVLKCERTRGGQYRLILKRDSIADNFNDLLNCPAYIKKGHVEDDDPLILTSEGVNVNQIKTEESLLQDDTQSAWVVGYLAKNAVTGEKEIQVTNPNDQKIDSITIEELAVEAGLTSGQLSDVINIGSRGQLQYLYTGNLQLNFWFNMTGGTSDEGIIRCNISNDFNNVWCNSGIDSTNTYTDWVGRFGYYYTADNMFNSAVSNPSAATIMNPIITPQLSAIKSIWSGFGRSSVYMGAQADTAFRNRLNTYIYANGKYYKLHYEVQSSSTNVISQSRGNAPFDSIVSTFISSFNNTPAPALIHKNSITDTHAGSVYVKATESSFYLYLTEVQDDPKISTVKFKINTTHNVIFDREYDIFMMPLNEVDVVDALHGINFRATGEYSLPIAIEMTGASNYQNKIYDIQILPYFPFKDEISNENEINLRNLKEHYDYDLLTYTGPVAHNTESSPVVTTIDEYAPGQYNGEAVWQSSIPYGDVVDYGFEIASARDREYAEEWIGRCSKLKTNVGGNAHFWMGAQIYDPQEFDDAEITVKFWVRYNVSETVNKSIIFYPKSANFTIPINKPISLKNEMKIEALCNNYRLVAPNYQGSFEFSVAKNGGSCSGFMAECTYRPYSPYIKVTPNFSWMYGGDYHDCRGLICGGDYSLGRYTSEWQQYQLNNKNYQNIFNREIQDLNVRQDIQRAEAAISGGLGIVTGGASGAASGGIASKSWQGAVIGGVLGTAGSAVGLAADLHYMEASMAEQRSYLKDKFNLSLGNIQALPYTLTKVSAFDINSKIWPILEYYTCTEAEKQYLRNKIQYEGMTVGVVDVLSKYMQLDSGYYCQAALIRNETTVSDNNLFVDIDTELNKGVYL